MILAGDIGGTNARLAYFRPQNGTFQMVSERVFPSRDYPGLGEIVSEFLTDKSVRPEIACFGIAGPVHQGRVEASNLPWVIEQSGLARQIQLPTTFLINDLEATAWGIGVVPATDLVSLNEVTPLPGNQAVIAPGTGLGEAGLVWDGKQHQVFACEGGHADFAPIGEMQIELLRFLSSRFGRVSYERVLSGPGLVNIYEFLCCQSSGVGPSNPVMDRHDPNAAADISHAALNQTDPMAEQALDAWISIYGAEAGNLALKIMAVGGVFLGGGISPKILSKLTGPLFMNAFLEKGRLKPLLESIPVRVVTNDKIGLLGAARYAVSKSRNGQPRVGL